MKKVYKQWFLILCGLLLFSVSNAQTLLYYNNFNEGKSVWTDYDDQYSNAKISGGKYVLTHKQHSYSLMASSVAIDYSRDFAIESTFSCLSGKNFPVGVTFGGKDVSNTYYFGISQNGQFVLVSLSTAGDKVLVKWTVNSAIKQGTASNRLRVEKAGNQFKYYVNDQQVAYSDILQPYGDKVGVIVADQQTAAFDYLKVVYLNQEVKTQTDVTAGITDMIYHTDFNQDDYNRWMLTKTDSMSTSFYNGYFNIYRTGKRNLTQVHTDSSLRVDTHRDYVVETSVAHYGGTEDYGYGLNFACDRSRQYHFCIALSGYYLIGYSQNGVFNTMTPWTTCDAIIKAEMSLNKLSIVHKDGQYKFYVNGQQVISYPDLNFTGHQFGVMSSSDQNVGFDYLTIGYLDKQQVKQNVDKAGPEITILSPQVTRGLKVVQSSNILHVVGNAKDPSGIFSVVVNDIQATVAKDGSFSADVPMAIGDNPLMVVATDMNMNKSNFRFNIVRNDISSSAQSNVTHSASQGKFYALLIGEQDYKDQSIQSLEGPVSDAQTLMTALMNNYTFASQNVTFLKNPTRADFFKALDDITSKITESDNLVIFYAGHGYYDEASHQGYWFPSDAVRTRKDTWISNADLIDYITEIKAKHTLLISDACFAGSIFKTRSIEMAPKDIQELYKLPSRKAMTSGNMKEVPDNSVFMKYLVERLNQNTDKFLPAEQLFSSFRAAVINNSPNQQVPQFGEIREAGDEGGDFIFIRKGN
jgi:glucodextranase-like protein